MDVSNGRKKSQLDLAWAAGLFDGEGTFFCDRGYARISITQKYTEVLERFQKIFDVGNIYHRKDGQYSFVVTKSNSAVDIYKLISPYLSPRKIQQAEEALQKVKQNIISNTNKTHCPQGHKYTEQNTYLDPRNRRHCRECRRGK